MYLALHILRSPSNEVVVTHLSGILARIDEMGV